MVVRRQLRVAAVGVDLACRPPEQHVAAERGARAAAAQLGQRRDDDVERERFAGQVRVRAEVGREVVLDVRQLAVERDEQIDEPRASSSSVASPSQKNSSAHVHDSAAKAELQHARPVDAVQRRVRRAASSRAARRTRSR